MDKVLFGGNKKSSNLFSNYTTLMFLFSNMDYDQLTRFATGIDWENAEQSIEKTQKLKKMIDEREERRK